MGTVFQQVIVLLSWFIYSAVLSELLDKDLYPAEDSESNVRQMAVSSSTTGFTCAKMKSNHSGNLFEKNYRSLQLVTLLRPM